MMCSKLPGFLVCISLAFFSCKNNSVNSYVEAEKGDSIFYYKDFDLYSFKGLHQLSRDSLNYPFVKMVYNDDSLVIKAYYHEKKTHQLLLLKLNGQWSNHSRHWSDGVTSHSFLVFTDTALYEFKFHRNPYGKTPEDLERPASLYSITVQSKKNDVIKYRYYQSFDWGIADYKEVPDIKKTKEKDWSDNCQSLIIGKDEIKDDTIRRVYQSYRRAYREGEYKELEKDGNEGLIKIPLVFNSEFYTKFLKM